MSSLPEPASVGAKGSEPKRLSPRRWHYLYYLLAAFNVFALAVSLHINRRIVAIHTQEVAVHQVWERRLTNSYRLDEWAAAANAPGNDIFRSDDVKAESKRMRAARRSFNERLDALRQELRLNVREAQAAPLVADLDRAQRAMAGMAGEAEWVFTLIRQEQWEGAEERMAMMDHKYAAINTALRDLRQKVNVIQEQLLIQQAAAAVSLQKSQYVIAVFIFLIVGGAVAYGYKLAKQMASDMRERERHIEDLRAAQAALSQSHNELEQRVEERTAELTTANEALQAEVSERRRAEAGLRTSEERFRIAAESASDLIYDWDVLNGGLAWFGPIDERLGYASGAFPHTLSAWEERIHPDDHDRVMAAVERHLETRIPFQEEYRVLRRDGTILHWMDRGVALRDENEHPVRWIGAVSDITEHKRSNEQTQRLQAQVVHSEKLAALGEMVAGVAHEINNPLAVIQGTAELLEMSEDALVREDAQSIRQMANRATKIVRSLLSFARIHDGERCQSAVRELVEATLEVCVYKLRKADIDLELRLAEDTPPVLVNDNQIQQILLNLLNNAEHALREKAGEKHIVLATSLEERDGTSWATVSITDNGCGISEETQRRIFDPFFTTKDIGEGTGLGLSICHGIAQAHGGVLTVTSAVGEGTTFTLALPAAASLSAQAAQEEQEEEYARAA